MSAGPWLLSIIGLLAVAVLSLEAGEGPARAQRFLVSTTHLIAASLIGTGVLQLTLTRFFADRLFENRRDLVLPNLGGAVLLVTVVAGTAGILVFGPFPASPGYRVLATANLVALANVWLLVLFLTSLKAYRAVLLSFAAGYALVVGGGWALGPFGIEGLLAALLLGHGALAFSLLGLVARAYPASTLVRWDFLHPRHAPPASLALAGLLYNAGVWADKILFWYAADTAHRVLGPLHANAVYDLPVFLAYLFVVPGLAVTLVRLETDFAEAYEAYYGAVLGGHTLAAIERRKGEMTLAARAILADALKAQALTALVVVVAAPRILTALGVAHAHLAVFRVAVVGVSGQVLLLAALNVLFYLDEAASAAALAGLLLVVNAALTAVTIALGPAFYGYGFAVSAIACAGTAVGVLAHRLRRWEYRTFTRQ